MQDTPQATAGKELELMRLAAEEELQIARIAELARERRTELYQNCAAAVAGLVFIAWYALASMFTA
jgi:hypothetical protein